jgi:hypothetical protein
MGDMPEPLVNRLGTIILAMRREQFAVLAADSLALTFFNGKTVPTRSHCKIVLHPSLPLGFATAGWAALPLTGQQRLTTEYLAEIAKKITKAAELNMPELKRRLAADLHPLVLEARKEPSCGLPDEYRKVDVYIAFVSKGRAELGRLRLNQNAELGERPEFFSLPSTEQLVAFYKMKNGYGNDQTLFRDDILDPDALGAHMRTVLQNGINFDAAASGGQNRTIGPPIHVAVIEHDGARWA